MMIFLTQVLMLILAYLIGSVSSAMIVAKKFNLPDPTTYGSNNPGASNVLRSGNKKAATYTLLGDVLKGLIAVGFARCVTTWAGLPDGTVGLAAFGVVLGHIFPIFFGFKGGKGVATALGVLLAMSFWAAAWVFGIWAVIAFKFKKSSLAGIVAAACAPFAAFIIIHHARWGWAVFAIAILVIYRHKENIQRLCSGNELGVETIEPTK